MMFKAAQRFNTQVMQKQMVRSFAAFNGAVSGAGAPSASDVTSQADCEWMGGYVSALVGAQSSGDMTEQNNAVDEYFRKNFRKLSVA